MTACSSRQMKLRALFVAAIFICTSSLNQPVLAQDALCMLQLPGCLIRFRDKFAKWLAQDSKTPRVCQMCRDPRRRCKSIINGLIQAHERARIKYEAYRDDINAKKDQGYTDDELKPLKDKKQLAWDNMQHYINRIKEARKLCPDAYRSPYTKMGASQLSKDSPTMYVTAGRVHDSGCCGCDGLHSFDQQFVYIDAKQTAKQARDSSDLSTIALALSDTQRAIRVLAANVAVENALAKRLGRNHPGVCLYRLHAHILPEINLRGLKRSRLGGVKGETVSSSSGDDRLYWRMVTVDSKQEAPGTPLPLSQLDHHIGRLVVLAGRIACARARAVSAARAGNGEIASRHLEIALILNHDARNTVARATRAWRQDLAKLLLTVKAFDEALAKQKLTPANVFSGWQTEVKRNGLPAEYVAALKECKLSNAAIAAHKRQIMSYDGSQSAAVLRFVKFFFRVEKLANKEPPVSLLPVAESYWAVDMIRTAKNLQVLDKTVIALKLQKGQKVPRWVVIPAGTSIVGHLHRSGHTFAEMWHVVPGKYDIYVLLNKLGQKSNGPLAVRVARDVQVVPMKKTVIPLSKELFKKSKNGEKNAKSQSGVSLKLGKGVPVPHSWYAMPHDADIVTVAGRATGKTRSMSLPPGRYDIFVAQTAAQTQRPLLIAKDIGVSSGKMSEVTVGSGLKLDLPDWVSSRKQLTWCAVKTGQVPPSPSQPFLNRATLNETLILAPGQYDLFVLEPGSGQNVVPIRFNVQVEASKIATMRAGAGVTLEVAKGVPMRTSSGKWYVVSAGGDPQEPFAWTNRRHSLLLPAGRYDVYWSHRKNYVGRGVYKDQPIPIATGVQIREGQHATVVADTVLKLNAPEWIEKPEWWGVVPAGNVDLKGDLVNWSRSVKESQFLAPGRYDIVMKWNYRARRVVASNVLVSSGTSTTVDLNTAIRIRTAEALRSAAKWWGVVKASDPPTKFIGSTYLTADGLLLQPGVYDIVWGPHRSGYVIARKITVKPGEITTTKLDTCMKIVVSEPAGKGVKWWYAVKASDPVSKSVAWTRPPNNVMPILPGKYDIVWSKDDKHVVARSVFAKAGQTTTVKLNTAVKITMSEAQKKDLKWWGVVKAADSISKLTAWTYQPDEVLLLPPGKYDIVWQRRSKPKSERVSKGIDVRAGSTVQVPLQPAR